MNSKAPQPALPSAPGTYRELLRLGVVDADRLIGLPADDPGITALDSELKRLAAADGLIVDSLLATRVDEGLLAYATFFIKTPQGELYPNLEVLRASFEDDWGATLTSARERHAWSPGVRELLAE